MGAVLSAECERARARASLAVDGELSQVGQASLRAHVGRCAACAEFALGLEALTKELRAAPLERPAAQVPARSRSALRTLHVAVAAAAVMLAAGMGSLAGSLTPDRAVRTVTSPSLQRAIETARAHALPGNVTHPIPL